MSYFDIKNRFIPFFEVFFKHYNQFLLRFWGILWDSLRFLMGGSRLEPLVSSKNYRRDSFGVVMELLIISFEFALRFLEILAEIVWDSS